MASPACNCCALSFVPWGPRRGLEFIWPSQTIKMHQTHSGRLSLIHPHCKKARAQSHRVSWVAFLSCVSRTSVGFGLSFFCRCSFGHCQPKACTQCRSGTLIPGMAQELHPRRGSYDSKDITEFMCMQGNEGRWGLSCIVACPFLKRQNGGVE